VGIVTVQGEDTTYQLSSAASSLTDLGDLPEIRTPEPFVSRRKKMQTMHAQMLRGGSLLRMSARLVSPWDFRFPSSGGGQSRDGHERTAVDILGLFAGVRGGGDCGEEGVTMDRDVERRELSPPPFMGVGYAEGAGVGGVEVVPSPEGERISEKMVITTGEGVQMGSAEAEVNSPVNCASRKGRMPEEFVLRSLTALVGWS